MTHRAIRAIATLAELRGLSLNEVSRRAGIARSLLSKWLRYESPRIDNVEAVLNALGYQLAVVPMAPLPTLAEVHLTQKIEVRLLKPDTYRGIAARRPSPDKRRANHASPR